MVRGRRQLARSCAARNVGELAAALEHCRHGIAFLEAADASDTDNSSKCPSTWEAEDLALRLRLHQAKCRHAQVRSATDYINNSR